MAGSAVVGALRVLLSMDTADYEQALVRASKSADKLSKDWASIGRQATAIGSTLTKAITLPLLGLATGASKLAIDFESSFAGVAKTVDGVVDKGGNLTEFGKELAQQFRDLSKQIPINVNDLNRLGEAAGALGIPKEEIVDFSRVMAMLGVTTNLTADQAAESIAQIQTQFQSAGKHTENFASALVHLGNNGASTESQILELTTRLASAGNAAGMSQADVLGFAAAMANVGIEAEAGGSALSRTFNEINGAVARGGEQLQQFATVAGMSSAAFAKQFKEDAAGAMEAFIVGLGNIHRSGGNLITTLDTLGMTELRQSDTLRRLALNTNNVTQALQDAREGWRQNTALSEEAQKRFQTVESQLTLLWNRVKDVGITLGNALLPALRTLVDLSGRLLPHLDKMATAFGELPGPVQATALGIGAVAAAAGPLLIVFGKLATAFSTVTAAFGSSGIATRALTPLLTSLSSAFTALTGVFSAGGVVVTALSRAFAVLTGPVGWFIGAAASVLTATGTWDELWRILKATGEIIVNVVAGAFQKLVEWGGQFLSWSGGLIRAASDVLGITDALRLFGEGLSWAAGLVGTAVSTIGGWFSKLGGWFASAMGWLADWTEGMALATGSLNRLLPETQSPFPPLTQGMQGAALSADELAKRLEEARASSAGLTGAVRNNTTATAANTLTKEQQAEADKRAKDAADAHTRALEQERQAVAALGLVTERDLNEQLREMGAVINRATAEGLPLQRVLAALLPKLEELKAKAAASGHNISALAAETKAWTKYIQDANGGIPTLVANINHLAPGMNEWGKGAKVVTAEMLGVQTQTTLSTRALEYFGIKTQAELDTVAQEARAHYEQLRRTVGVTAQDLEGAWQKVLEAERRGRKEAVPIWREYVDQVKGLFRSLGRAFTDQLVGINSALHDSKTRAADDARDAFQRTEREAADSVARAEQQARDERDRTVQHAEESYTRELDALGTTYQQKLEQAGKNEEARKNVEIWYATERQRLQEEHAAALVESDRLMNEAIKLAAEEANGKIAESHASMEAAIEAASHPWKDRMVEIWGALKAGVQDILSQMLSDFLTSFLGGMLQGAMSWAQQMGRIIGSVMGLPTGMGSLPGTFMPGATALGAAPGGAGAGTAAAGIGVGTAAAMVVAPAAAYTLGKMGYEWVTAAFGPHFNDAMASAQMEIDAMKAGAEYQGKTLEQVLAEGGTSLSAEAQQILAGMGIPGFEKGTNGRYVDFGAGTLAMLHGREMIVPEGNGGGGTVVVNVDGARMAEVLLPHWPTAREWLGVN